MLESLTSISAELSSALTQLHFLRPWYLLALIPGPLFALLLSRQNRQSGNWQNVIAPELQPYLLKQYTIAKQYRLHWWLLLPWLCASLALAGPSWSKIPLPIHKQQSPLVILLDLSPSMLTEDIKPNRLTRARLKLIDLLQRRQEGTTALIAYANDAHVVTPLTDDTETIISLLPALSPGVMPESGNQPTKALASGIELIRESGFQQGHILLVSDGIPSEDLAPMQAQLKGFGGLKVSVLALGTTDGAPIPTSEGGFVKNRLGSIIIAQLQEKPLQSLARSNGGQYQKISLNDDDIDVFIRLFDPQNSEQSEQLQRTFDTWHDSGFWLLLPILPLLILAFRRNLLALFIITPLLLGSDNLQAFEWQDLWLRSDQQGQKALASGDTASAEKLFKNPDWKGSAAYQNDNFAAAQEYFKAAGTNTDKPDANNLYNLANAQVKSDQLEEALENYTKALKLQNDHQDAAFNKNLVEKLLQQQKQQQDPSQDNKDNQEKGGPPKDSDPSPKPGQSQDQQGKKSDQGQQDNKGSPGESSDQPADSSSTDQGAKDKQNQDRPETGEQDGEKTDSDKETDAANAQQSEAEAEQQEPSSAQPSLAERMPKEQRQALEQWLRRVPDDPSGLMRRKFEYEAWQRNQQAPQQSSAPQQEDDRW